MVEQLKESWSFLKDFFSTTIGWFAFGFILGAFASYIQWQRAESLAEYLKECSANERTLNADLRTCREDAGKDFIRSFGEQVELMRDLGDVLKTNNENTRQQIEQKKIKAENDKKIIKVLKDKSNESN